MWSQVKRPWVQVLACGFRSQSELHSQLPQGVAYLDRRPLLWKVQNGVSRDVPEGSRSLWCHCYALCFYQGIFIPQKGGFLPEALLVISGSFVASKPRERNQGRQLMCCRIISDKISELLVEGKESMVTYLKTLIYIQDTSCAGLRVWPAILDISAGF